MFAEVKELLTFIEGDAYDGKIIAEIKACALDLTTSAEIVLPGEIDITRTHEAATTSEPERWVITDNSTITDELIIKVIAVWCNKEIGNPPNYDALQASYNSLKGQLRLSDKYTKYHPEEDPETPEGAEGAEDEETPEGTDEGAGA